jgi:eukaryotic-like serine/threonine-protein kinase
MLPVPPRLTTALADRYRIEQRLGEGGMATVYLAHDVRHDRKVALKVLRPELAAVIGAERFLAEIRTTANLQHPHILPLFDSGEADSFLFYVMPYIDGESLRDRLAREKHLPIADALRVATGVAAALDYAHRRDVVHRDIKPENILLHDGQPLVADFGIALALSTAGSARMTETGLSLGTPTYMSPEQAMGEREIDARADIYSLGCVVYEMLTGDPPFTGSTAQAIAARILTEAPRSLTTQRHTIPAHVEAAVLTALEKLPADRFPTAQAFAEALERPGVLPPPSRGASTPMPTRGWRSALRHPLVQGLAAVTVGALAMAGWAWTRTPAVGKDEVVRYVMDPPEGTQLLLQDTFGPNVTISPDGSTVCFVTTNAQGTRQLYVRRLDELEGRPLPGTEGAYLPSFSPDGQWIGYWLAGRIMKVALAGGAPQLVAEYGNVIAQTWIPGGDILLTRTDANHLITLPGDGSAARPTAPMDTARGETGQFFPHALPDGRHVLYTSWGRGGLEDVRIGVLDLRTGTSRRLDLRGTYVLGMLDGVLIYSDQTGTVFAVRMDVTGPRLTGAPVAVASGVVVGLRGSAIAALSDDGTLVYRSGGTESTLALTDGQGVTSLLPEVRSYGYPRFSPDGRRVAVTVGSGAASDIWIYDLASRSLSRLSSGGSVNERPEWTPDGSRVLFRSDRGARSAIWWQPADGSGTVSPLVADDRLDIFEGVMTPDGQHVIVQVDTAGADLYYRRVQGDTTLHPIATGPFEDSQPRVSPDGRWVAFAASEGDLPQVVVQPFPGPGGRVQISRNGGREPVWAPDGRRIFYRSGEKIRAANVSATPTFRVTSHEDLMDDSFLPAAAPHANYDVTPDGAQFLVLQGSQTRLVVVHNWGAAVRGLLRNGPGR